MPAVPILEIQGETFRMTANNFIPVLNKVLDLPVAILSINGKSREGKSYVFNYFLRYLRNEGRPGWFEMDLPQGEFFPWRSGSQRVTLGINVWSEPLVCNLRGERVAVILLDCQGLFDEYTTQQQNSAIFALSCLLSSVMVYNVKNKIDDEKLEKIDLFSDYTRAVSSSLASSTALDGRPSFLFLVRDFEFVNEFEFGFHTKDEQPEPSRDCCGNYYSRVFSTSSTMPKETVRNRRNFEDCFSQASVFLLPYPGMKFIDNSDQNSPKVLFRNLLEEFVQRTMANLTTKRIGTEEITGRSLKSYVEKWAELCQDGNFPESSTIKDLTVQLQNEKAVQLAAAHFRRLVGDYLFSSLAGSADDETFRGLFGEFYNEASQTYLANRSLGDEDSVHIFLIELESLCRKHFEEYSVRENQWLREGREWEEKKEKIIKSAVTVGAATFAVAAKVAATEFAVHAARSGCQAVQEAIEEAGSSAVIDVVNEAVSTLAASSIAAGSSALTDVAGETASALASQAVEAASSVITNVAAEAATALTESTVEVGQSVLASAASDVLATMATEALSMADVTGTGPEAAASVVNALIETDSVVLAGAAAAKSFTGTVAAIATEAGTSVFKKKMAVAALAGTAVMAGPAILAGPAAAVSAAAIVGALPAACFAAAMGVKGILSKW